MRQVLLNEHFLILALGSNVSYVGYVEKFAITLVILNTMKNVKYAKRKLNKMPITDWKSAPNVRDILLKLKIWHDDHVDMPAGYNFSLKHLLFNLQRLVLNVGKNFPQRSAEFYLVVGSDKVGRQKPNGGKVALG